MLKHSLRIPSRSLAIAGLTVASVMGGATSVWAQSDIGADAAPVVLEQGVQGDALVPMLQNLIRTHDWVLEAQAKVDVARDKVKAARSGYMPSVDAFGQVGRERIAYPSDTAATASNSFQDYTLEARQPVYDFGKTSGAIDLARARLKAAQLDLESVRQQLLIEGAKTYFDAARSLRGLRYARNAENNVRAKTGMEQALARQGAQTGTATLRAQKQLIEAQLARVQRENELLSIVHHYQALFGKKPSGLENGPTQTINVRVVPPTIEDAISQAIVKNLDIRRADLDLEAARFESSVGRAQMYPDVALVANNRWQRNVDNVLGQVTTTRGMVELNVPLFSGFEKSSLYNASLKGVAGAQHASANARRDAIRDVRVAWQNLVSTQRASELYQGEAKVDGDLLREVRLKQGRSASSLDVVDVETDFIRAVSKAMDAESDMMVSAVDLFAKMGILRPEALPELFVDAGR